MTLSFSKFNYFEKFFKNVYLIITTTQIKDLVDRTFLMHSIRMKRIRNISFLTDKFWKSLNILTEIFILEMTCEHR